MQWSPIQDKALRDVDDWYRNRRFTQQVFRLFGYAGTGKTTLARHFAEGIGGTVKFATYTGKAAHIMATKGCAGCTTIHKLIYIPRMNSKKRLYEIEEAMDAEKAKPEPNHELLAKYAADLEAERKNFGRPNFTLNLESDLRFANLLIIDECSMVDKQMGMDLQSFGIPILVLGDPEQLPPIFGAGHFTNQPPDILLTEIHRQAGDNPIIEMSRRIREGLPLALGSYGNSLVTDRRISAADALENDIILVGRRATKRGCDMRVRALKEFKSELPVKGDRLICVRNNGELGLLNGQMFNAVYDATVLGSGDISIHIQGQDDPNNELAVTCAEDLFHGIPLEKWDHRDGIEEFEYGYALTVHKAQGSQWNNVLLMDEAGKFPNYSAQDRRRWLYTAITRAAERVTVVRL
jgi:exodeoxyribonuclease-5